MFSVHLLGFGQRHIAWYPVMTFYLCSQKSVRFQSQHQIKAFLFQLKGKSAIKSMETCMKTPRHTEYQSDHKMIGSINLNICAFTAFSPLPSHTSFKLHLFQLQRNNAKHSLEMSNTPNLMVWFKAMFLFYIE